ESCEVRDEVGYTNRGQRCEDGDEHLQRPEGHLRAVERRGARHPLSREGEREVHEGRRGGQVVAVTANQGNNLIFTVFAAAVIGGIALEGGRGRMFGAFTGVVLLGLVQNILVLSQIQTFWIDAANGAIILIALGLARLVGTSRG